MRLIIGIDPGIHGGISHILDDPRDSIVLVKPMPTIKVRTESGKQKTEYDLPALRKIIADPIIALRARGEKPNVVVYIERQQAMVKFRDGINAVQGTTSTFMTGRGFGTCEGMACGLGLAIKYVHSRRWQSRMIHDLKPGTSKQRSIELARSLFPHVSLKPTKFSREDADGMSDALLIAEYGRRELGALGIE